MAFNIGINVIESDGRSTPAITGASTSVAGLLLRSQRGPTNRALQVFSFNEFQATFGGPDSRFLGSYCANGFFANSGQEAWITRIVGDGGAAAAVTLKDHKGNFTLKVEAGSSGLAEPGTWGNSLSLNLADNPAFSTLLMATLVGNKPARLQGTPLAATVNLSVASGVAPLQLVLNVDSDAAPFTVIFDATTLPVPDAAAPSDIAAAINARAGSRVVASVNASGLLIVSLAKGTNSIVAVISGTAADTATRKLLGFADGDVTATGTAIPLNTAYNSVQVRGIGGLKIGQWVRLDDGITETFLKLTGLVQGQDGAGNATYTVQWTAPGANDQQEYRIEDGATLSTCEFNLTVLQTLSSSPIPQQVEVWEKLTMDPTQPNYAISAVNDPNSGSSFVVLTDSKLTTYDGSHSPAPAKGITLGIATPTTTGLTRVPGNDGSDPSTSDYLAALPLYDNVAIQLLAAPEAMPEGMLRAVTTAAIAYCEGPTKGDCMFVGHTPGGFKTSAAKAFGQDFRASKVYGALYWPWVTVTDPAGSGSNPTVVIPPTGHVLGVYARTAQNRGIAKAPAGNDAVLLGVLAVERDITDVDHTDLVKNGSVNGVRRIPGAGIIVDASRTLSTDTRWLYVNVRLLFNYVKASLRDGLRWVKQEPNTDTLWNKVKYNAVIPFLLRLYQQGAFGAGKPADVFTVICGAENNPPSEVMLGNLRVEVYFYPSRPAETIVIVVGQQEAGGSAAEG